MAEGLDFDGPNGFEGRRSLLYTNPFLVEPYLYGRSNTPLDIGRDRPYDYKKVHLPVAEDIARRKIAIQMRPTYSDEDIGDIIEGLQKVAAYYRA